MQGRLHCTETRFQIGKKIKAGHQELNAWVKWVRFTMQAHWARVIVVLAQQGIPVSDSILSLEWDTAPTGVIPR